MYNTAIVSRLPVRSGDRSTVTCFRKHQHSLNLVSPNLTRLIIASFCNLQHSLYAFELFYTILEFSVLRSSNTDA